MTAPEGFDIHNPEWWEREDSAFDARMDSYEGQPMTEEVRATLLTLAWGEIAQLRVVARTLALESHAKRVHTPRRRGDGAD